MMPAGSDWGAFPVRAPSGGCSCSPLQRTEFRGLRGSGDPSVTAHSERKASYCLKFGVARAELLRALSPHSINPWDTLEQKNENPKTTLGLGRRSRVRPLQSMNDPFWKIAAIIIIGLLALIAFLLCVALIRRKQPTTSPPTTSAVPQDDQPEYTEAATLAAIHTLSEIDDAFEELAKQELPEQSVEAAVAQNRTLAQTLSSYSTRLSVFQLVSVEPSVAAIFGPMADFYAQLASVSADYAAFYERQETCIRNHTGLWVILESTIRGIVNQDFVSRGEEVDAAFEQLMAERAELRKQVDILHGVRHGLFESLEANFERLSKLHGWAGEV